MVKGSNDKRRRYRWKMVGRHLAGRTASDKPIPKWKTCLRYLLVIGVFLLCGFLFSRLVDYLTCPKIQVLDDVDALLLEDIEEEFLFSLPPGAKVDELSQNNSKDRIAGCIISGDFTWTEFKQSYMRFVITGIAYGFDDGTYKIDGFPDSLHARVRYSEKDGKTTVIIRKRGIANKRLQQALDSRGKTIRLM